MPALTDHLAWINQFTHSAQYKSFINRPIAYFCSEFAFSSHLPMYAGGLGVLAADLVKEASDRNFPLVGVGLWYGPNPPSDLKPVLDTAGNRLIIAVPIVDEEVSLQAWKYQVGNVQVFLLDSHVNLNSSSQQAITHKLYVTDKETRLRQEIILGIGGFRLLAALNINPYKYHLNEGHSGFLLLELIAAAMHSQQLNFIDALPFAGSQVVFTNHTLLPAGQELYSNDLVAMNLALYAQKLGVPVGDILRLGLVEDSSTFSMTLLCLRLASVSNAVSLLHSVKARELWTDHPMTAVTNGIHLPTWDTIPPEWETPGRLTELHANTKNHLLHYLKLRQIDWPAKDIIIGWGRRLVDYKRPLEIFSDLDRLAALARNPSQSFRIIISGQSKETGAEGQALEQQLLKITSTYSDFCVYLPDYDLELAKLLTAGCDIWLNTPIVGYEACGTSGMKAALNGVLPLSTRDGWFAEINPEGIGWTLDNDHCAASFYDLMANQILPLYYNHPQDWEKSMRQARDLICDRFSATRMLREYIEKLYLNTASQIY